MVYAGDDGCTRGPPLGRKRGHGIARASWISDASEGQAEEGQRKAVALRDDADTDATVKHTGGIRATTANISDAKARYVCFQ